MIRLSNKDKKRYMKEAEERLASAITIDWPLKLVWLSNTEVFCSKCNTPFVATKRIGSPYSGHEKKCPVHGSEEGRYKWGVRYFYYEKKSEQEFWIYDIVRSFNRQTLMFTEELDNLVVFMEQDTFCLRRTAKGIARRQIDTVIRSYHYPINSNLEELLDNKVFVDETGILEFYTLRNGKPLSRKRNKERLTEDIKKGGVNTLEILIRTMKYHKKDFYDIEILEKNNYSSLLEYMSEQKLYQSLNHQIVKGRDDIISFNKDAKSLNELLSEDIKLSERINNISLLSEDRMRRIKLLFGELEGEDEDAFFEMINSPIVGVRGTSINSMDFESLYELNRYGYKMKDIWNYIKKLDLYEGVDPEVAIEKLRAYIRFNKVKGQEVKALPDNLISQELKLARELRDRDEYYRAKIFELDSKINMDYSFSEDDILIEKISSYEDLKQLEKEIDIKDSIHISSYSTANNFFIIQRMVAGDIKPLSIARINEYTEITHIYDSFKWNRTQIASGIWILASIKKWAKKMNLIEVYK